MFGKNNLQVAVDHFTLVDLVEAIRLTKQRSTQSGFHFDILLRKKLETNDGEMLQFCGFHYHQNLFMVLYYYGKSHKPWKPLTLFEWQDDENALEEFVKKATDLYTEPDDNEDECITFDKCLVDIDPVQPLFTLYNKNTPDSNGITMHKNTMYKLVEAMEEATVASMNNEISYGLIFHKVFDETDGRILKLHGFHVAYTLYMALICDSTNQTINFTKFEDQKMMQLLNDYMSVVNMS